MKNKKKLIPELRFPEFKDSGEWNYDKLDNLFYLQDGYAFSSDDFTDSKQNSKQVIRITDINNQNKNADKIYIGDNSVKILGLEKYKVKRGDLLLSLTGAAGFNFFIWKSEDAYINQRTVKIDSKKKENDSLKIILEPLVHSKINQIGTGQNNNLSKDALKEIEFPFPTPKEQQRIASCLSSLDEVIEAQSKKLELLKAHKKGLMQNLFPQEGEKVPKLRFKEFENEGEWKIEPLENLSKEIVEKTKGRKYKLMSITSGVGLVSQIEKFGKEIAGNSYKNYYVIQKYDFAYNKSSTKLYGEGEIAMYEDDEIGAVPNSIFTCFRFNHKKIYPNFAKYPFINNIHGNWLRKFIAVGARANGALQVNTQDLFSLPFPFPSIAEQQKIASCLSSLDELIVAQAKKIEQLKLHKKGLMQGLFPKIY